MSNFGNYDGRSDDPIDLERLLPAAVARILKDEDPVGFRTWLAANLHDYAGEMLKSAPAEMFRAMAVSLSFMIWNALPLPGNEFRPQPLDKPERNDPCPCGSGLKYKKCCSGAPPVPSLDTMLFWPLVLQNLPEARILQAAAQGQIPLEGLTLVAMHMMDEDRAREAIEILRPHFQQLPKKSRPMDDMALQILCDAFDALDLRDDKLALLERVTRESPRSPLRAGAWQRLAVIRIDEDNLTDAAQALENAMRDDPDEPSSAIIELQLLARQENWALIKARAQFWLRKLNRPGYDPEAVESLVNLLEEAVENPQGVREMLEESYEDFAAREDLDEFCVRLLDWIAKGERRPLPAYRAMEEEDGADDEQQLKRRLRGMGLGDKDIAEALAMLEEQKEQLLEEDDLSEEPDEEDFSLILAPPPALEDVETQWQRIFDLGKPFGTQEISDEDWDGWEPGKVEAWLTFLEKHPEAIDSLEIIDDLLSALFLHPAWPIAAMIFEGVTPLLGRAAAIVEQSTAGLEQPLLRWNRTENRPALRSLCRLYVLERHGRENLKEAERLALEMIRLNPHDNHGLRSELMNDLLRRGENEKALELARCYPDDLFAETRYGMLLALYRLGRLHSAQDVAEQAVEKLPLVARFLVRARAKKPKTSGYGISVGGEDQAWLYREEMRDAWQETPGALDWLKKIMKLKGVRA
ncbi:SEC-C metal-binding domain-containing protein [Geoalkalibacter halelectricus]|uniref:SEC-C domain-containing protein n=1 Tax=Geoalkalibacter halelectricus TaxID=2847045 RepID=A0ABY5ZV88_9BACT|nr:SEC-C metal-binding domain-containing protein [Geoalkalibacter halelectricus]MDO3377953.1 SEC-C metal-binding domain-containing protein [Geoalkalibacter halelectricus]UWZ81544.1 SEC-C domain-containing protein [Geoalkalibacter halelectricus]